MKRAQGKSSKRLSALIKAMVFVVVLSVFLLYFAKMPETSSYFTYSTTGVYQTQ